MIRNTVFRYAFVAGHHIKVTCKIIFHFFFIDKDTFAAFARLIGNNTFAATVLGEINRILVQNTVVAIRIFAAAIYAYALLVKVFVGCVYLYLFRVLTYRTFVNRFAVSYTGRSLAILQEYKGMLFFVYLTLTIFTLMPMSVFIEFVTTVKLMFTLIFVFLFLVLVVMTVVRYLTNVVIFTVLITGRVRLFLFNFSLNFKRVVAIFTGKYQFCPLVVAVFVFFGPYPRLRIIVASCQYKRIGIAVITILTIVQGVTVRRTSYADNRFFKLMRKLCKSFGIRCITAVILTTVNRIPSRLTTCRLRFYQRPIMTKRRNSVFLSMSAIANFDDFTSRRTGCRRNRFRIAMTSLRLFIISIRIRTTDTYV